MFVCLPISILKPFQLFRPIKGASKISGDSYDLKSLEEVGLKCKAACLNLPNLMFKDFEYGKMQNYNLIKIPCKSVLKMCFSKMTKLKDLSVASNADTKFKKGPFCVILG